MIKAWNLACMFHRALEKQPDIVPNDIFAFSAFFQDGRRQTGSTYISACRPDSNEIPKAIPMFSGSSNPMRLRGILYNINESGYSNIAMKFQVTFTIFGSGISSFQLYWYEHCNTQPVSKARWRLSNWEYHSIPLCPVGFLEPENIGNSLWNFVASWPRSWDTSISGLKAAICEYPLPFMLYGIPLSLIGLLEPENIGIAFGMSLLSGLQAEI